VKRADPEPWRCFRCDAPFERLHDALEHEKRCEKPFKLKHVKVQVANLTKHVLDVSALWNPNTMTVEVQVKEKR
jgi:hypothetical protein